MAVGLIEIILPASVQQGARDLLLSRGCLELWEEQIEMVIAPVLGPSAGLSLAAARGDVDLFCKSIRAITEGHGRSSIRAIDKTLSLVFMFGGKSC